MFKEIIENFQPRIDVEQVRLLCDPALVAYSGAGNGGDKSGALPIISARLTLPRAASVVPISDWLPGSLVRTWNSPTFVKERQPAPACVDGQGERVVSLPDEMAQRGFFNTTMSQWRGLARRMCRCGLGILLDANSCSDDLAAGAFAVAKNQDKDRLIGDRRPCNVVESRKGVAKLPCAPRLRRLLIQKHQIARVSFRDISDCFYVFGVDEERLHRQVVGPRVPRSWFHDLENNEIDEKEVFDAWHFPDLFPGSCNSSVIPQKFCQLAISGVIMGDRDAVYAIESAHRRQLLAAGVLSPDTMLLSGSAFPCSACIGDVCIDDVTHFSLKTAAEASERIHAADEFYQGVGMPVSAEAGGLEREK